MPGIRQRAYCLILIDGKDVTSKFDPYLISVTVIDKEGEEDTCQIQLDDTDGVVELPQDGGSISIKFGWGEGEMDVCFEGTIAEVESAGQRKSGRRLFIEGTGSDPKGKAKQPQTLADGEGSEAAGGVAGGGGGSGPAGATGGGGGGGVTLQSFMDKAAKLSGHKVSIDSSLGQLTRGYWLMTNESFIHFGERIAREVGGVFKITGNDASITKSGSGNAADGSAMAVVEVKAADNLIGWRLKPFIGRPQYNKTGVQHFDLPTSEIQRSDADVPAGAGAPAKAEHTQKMAAAEPAQGQAQAQGDTSASSANSGDGWIMADGDGNARAGGKCQLSGARYGVDGTWSITEVEHTYLRAGGWTTRMDVNNPAGGVGTDSRASPALPQSEIPKS